MLRLCGPSPRRYMPSASRMVRAPRSTSVAKRFRSAGVRSCGAPIADGSSSGTSCPFFGIPSLPDPVRTSRLCNAERSAAQPAI